jgi:fused signal recognition particle receptor
MSFFGFGKKKKPDPQPDMPVVAETEIQAESASEAEIAPAAPRDAEPEIQANKGWLERLRAGLAQSTGKISTGIGDIFTKRPLDEATLQELEELLITADLGPRLAAKLTADFAKTRFGKTVEPAEVKTALATQIEALLQPYAQPLRLTATPPHIVLVIGVNGVGKTTTIGKLAKFYRDQNLKVMLAAGDTFRAAAVGQLQIWGERTGCPVMTAPEGGDAAALAYQATQKAQAEGMDLLLIDTAGRLHNKQDLMDELAKIIRVLRKLVPEAPHDTLLVLDATTGQNALAQAENFQRMANVTGLIVTKLDGSAKGGVLLALTEKFKLPIHAIGVGETAVDLRPFAAADFARALVGLEPASS